MFQYRSRDFGPRVTAIQKHLGAVERELEEIGRIAGKRGTAAAASAGEQIGDAVSGFLGDIVERFQDSNQAAGEWASRLGSQTFSLGRSYGSNALERVSAEVEGRPLITVAVALGIGVLIGAAVLANAGGRKEPARRSRRR